VKKKKLEARLKNIRDMKNRVKKGKENVKNSAKEEGDINAK